MHCFQNIVCTQRKENNNKIENNHAFLIHTFLKNNPMEKGRLETTLEVKLLAYFKEVVAKELKTFLTLYYVIYSFEQKVSTREKPKQRQWHNIQS